MTACNLTRRRRTATPLADHPEPCEVRTLLSGVAIYPAQAEVKDSAAVAPAGKVSPLDLAPSDYNGTWVDIGFLKFDLTVKGKDPETAKVKGTLSSIEISGGPAKFKGKISNFTELEGTTRVKVTEGPFTFKLDVVVSVHLTDSTHFEGLLNTFSRGIPQGSSPISLSKI